MAQAITVKKNLRSFDVAERITTVHAKSKRLEGALAAGTAISASGTAKERIDVEDVSSITVVLAVSAGGQGTGDLDIHGMASDATSDDTDGADRLAGVTDNDQIADVSSAAQATVTLDVTNMKFVEVEVTASGTGGDNIDVAWVDVFVN